MFAAQMSLIIVKKAITEFQRRLSGSTERNISAFPIL